MSKALNINCPNFLFFILKGFVDCCVFFNEL